MGKTFYILLILTFFSLGCSAAEVALPTAVSPIDTPVVEQTAVPLATIPPTSTMPPPPTPLIVPSATPEPTAVPLTLALPPDWAHLNIAELDNWHIISHENPAQAMANGTAQAALIVNGGGNLLWQQPIALAVAWTVPWESVTLGQALDIQQNGHDTVTMMPWQDLPPTMKALRINGRSPADADYPLQTRLSLLANTGISTADLTSAIQAQLPHDKTIHLTAVGDLMLSRRLGSAVLNGNVNYPFAEVMEHLQRADITVGNVESALGSGGTPEDKRYPFIAPPETAVSLANAGFDVVSLANNHGMDYGADTLLEAISLLTAQNIATIGAGADASQAYSPHIEQINGLTIAFLGYVNVPIENWGFDTQRWTATESSAGLAWGTPEQITADVTAVSADVDLVVVVLHSGYEYIPAPSPPQVAASRAAIDAGAELVIGHHAHILQGVEYYNGGVIAYGLGNFAFDIDGAPETAVLDVWLDAAGVRELRYTPAIIEAGGQPRFANDAEAKTILDGLYMLTAVLNSSQ